MTLKSYLTGDLDTFYNTDELADTVIYSGEEITAVLDYEEDLGDEGASKEAGALLRIRVSDVSNPAYRDTVVIGSTTWTVMKVVSGDGYEWVLRISRDRRPTYKR